MAADSAPGLTGVLEPLNDRVFRILWGVSFAANLTMITNEVAAAWLMTQLTDQVLLVALVQSAATLPMFLLGIPSGALADIVDRRRHFAVTQLLVGVVALILAGLALTDALTAHGLLFLTLANGVAVAMRWPVFSAILPDIVPRERLAAALSLNAISVNISRIVGPMIAGALLASLGSPAVFAVNAILASVAFTLILRWKSQPRTSALPGERFLGAIRVGVQHVLQAPQLRIILVKVFLLLFQAAAVISLMPLLARKLGASASGFTLLLACMGLGAVTGAFNVNRLRARWDFNQIVRGGTLLQLFTTVAMAYVPSFWLACPVMFAIGALSMCTVNTLTVSMQMGLPNWVRARGMSAYQMAMMGGSALGAALWGQIASVTDLRTSLVTAAAVSLVALGFTWRQRIAAVQADMTPVVAGDDPVPAIPVDPDDGPVMVMIEFVVDPAQAANFSQVMLETRAARLRQGALSWGLFCDAEVPGRYIEYFVDETWNEHLRRLERFTAADVELRARRVAFHIGGEPPKVKRYIGQTLRQG